MEWEAGRNTQTKGNNEANYSLLVGNMPGNKKTEQSEGYGKAIIFFYC